MANESAASFTPHGDYDPLYLEAINAFREKHARTAELGVRESSAMSLATVDANGLPTWSAYVGANSPLPEFRARPRRRNALLACAGASAAVGSGLYGWSMASRGALKANAKDQSIKANALDSSRGATNALSVSSVSFIGVSVGCAGSAVAVGRR